MIDTKKEQERDELHRAIWAIADELRGAVDGWDFKNYVLGTMFYRYISENLANYISEGEIKAGNDGFDYARMSDAEAESARRKPCVMTVTLLPTQPSVSRRESSATSASAHEQLTLSPTRKSSSAGKKLPVRAVSAPEAL